MVPAPDRLDPFPLADHLAPLRPLLGRWQTTGVVYDAHGHEAAEIHGHDTWAPLPGGRWLAHESATRVGDRLAHLHQVIGGAHPDGGWQMLAFEEGPLPELTRLVQAEPGVMQVRGEGTRARFGLTDGPGPMVAHWELNEHGSWARWMQVRYLRRS